MQPDSSIHWSAYPALLVAGAFALGISIQSSGVGSAPLLWCVGVAIGCLLFVAAELWDARRLVTLAPLGRITALTIVVVCAGGGARAAYHWTSPRALESVATKTDDSITVAGEIRDAPERSDGRVSFTLAVERALGPADTSTVTGAVRVTLGSSPWQDHSRPYPPVYQGDDVRLTGRLGPAPDKRNPGGFDYAAYLARRGVCCTMYVGSPDRVLQVDRGQGWFTNLVVDLRRYVRRQIDRFVPTTDGRTVLDALLLGDRSGITDDQRQRFAQTGLMHLLAVSGLHVFLVGMVLYVLLQPLLLRLRLSWRTVEVCRATLTVLVLGSYLLLTGARPSVVRAVVMSALFIGGVLFQRSTHPLNTLGVAALVLLALRPPALFDAGFQLSMAAVAGIVTLRPRLLDVVPDAWQEATASEWLVSMVAVSAAAMIGTAPVLFYHFGWVSGAGLLLNIVGIPVTGLALSAAVAMEVFGGIWPLAGVAFGQAASLFVDILLLTSRHGADWLGWAGLRVSSPSAWTLLSLVAGIVAVAQWPRPRLRWRCIVGALLTGTIGLYIGLLSSPTQSTLDLLFFDVGQGDAVLVSTPGDRHILVDTGPRSMGGDGAAAYSVLPYLRSRGIDRLDMVVVTHPDEDHLGGLPAILRDVTVGRVVHSGQAADTDLYRETRRLLSRQSVPSVVARRGDTLDVGAGVRMEVLGPPNDVAGWDMADVNERSLVLRLTYGGIHVLLPGDVEADAETNLVATYGDQLASHVVKIPHHGSETSSTPKFVDAVADSSLQTRAVVSVGRENQFGMPSERVMSRWTSTTSSTASTASDGAVWLRTNGRSVWPVDWKSEDALQE